MPLENCENYITLLQTVFIILRRKGQEGQHRALQLLEMSFMGTLSQKLET